MNKIKRPDRNKYKEDFIFPDKLLKFPHQMANDIRRIAITEYEAYHKYKLSQLPTKEEMTDIASRNLLPFADSKWRANWPKDNWKWDEKTLKTLSKIVATAIHNRLNVIRKGE